MATTRHETLYSSGSCQLDYPSLLCCDVLLHSLLFSVLVLDRQPCSHVLVYGIECYVCVVCWILYWYRCIVHVFGLRSHLRLLLVFTSCEHLAPRLNSELGVIKKDKGVCYACLIYMTVCIPLYHIYPVEL